MKTRLLLLPLCLLSLWIPLFPSLPGFASVRLEEEGDLVERGRYLATVAGACQDCHTPHRDGKPDPERLFAGHTDGEGVPVWDKSLAEKRIGYVVCESNTAFAGPWGRSYASNLTPDPSTGIGAWNEALFIRTLQRGEYHFPMPAHLKELSRNDLKAIWRYLQTVPPIFNRVPPFEPADRN